MTSTKINEIVTDILSEYFGLILLYPIKSNFV